jgi:hypothetical protein
MLSLEAPTVRILHHLESIDFDLLHHHPPYEKGGWVVQWIATPATPCSTSWCSRWCKTNCEWGAND